MKQMERDSTSEPGKSAGFIERLADRIARHANAATVYGEPVERSGVTVIPVAKVRYGFGGGSGEGENNQEGSGGGGGMMAAPVGFIEIRDGDTTFRSIKDPMALLPIVAAAGLGGLLLLRGFTKLAKVRAEANPKPEE